MRRLLVPVLLAVVASTGVACGGDDVFPRDEFVAKLKEAGVEKPVGECVYAAIEKDKVVMADVVRAGGPNDDISAKNAKTLERIVARCILGANPPR